MTWTSDQLDAIQIHFVLCTERTGSSILSLMLNLNQEVISPSEEQFALYFYKKYKNKTPWNDQDLEEFVKEFYLLFDRNFDLYFEDRTAFEQLLKEHKDQLNYSRLIKLCYLSFYDSEVKDKSSIKFIIDKQIKYVYHLDQIISIFPEAKFIILCRNIQDNIKAKQKRKLNWNQEPSYLAAIWEGAYSRALEISESKRIIISFEELLSHPETILKEISNFIGFTYDDKMLATEGVFDQLIQQRKSRLDSKYLEKLNQFHSGLKKTLDPEINKKNSGSSKNIQLTQKQNIIMNKLGYETQGISGLKSENIIPKFLAYCYRPLLLDLYLQLPLSIKVIIKQFKKKKQIV
jgi:hypothetical protein